MLKVSKEQLYEELQDMIRIMNRDDYLRDPNMVPSRVCKKKQGTKAATVILKRFKKTTLYELDRGQLQEAIDIIHKIPIRGL